MKSFTARMLMLSLSVSILSTSVVILEQPAEAARTYRAGATVSRDMRVANQLLQNGKYADAEAQFTAMLKKNPNNLPARSGLAFAQSELYKLDAAEKNAKQVLQKNSKDATAHAALGIVYRNRTASADMFYKASKDELLMQSAQELEKAVRLDGNSPEIHNQLGVTYRMQGRFAEAEKHFDKALDLDPKYAEAVLNQGIMEMNKGNLSAAKDQFNQAIRMNSRNPMAHYRLGEALIAEEDYHGALKVLNTALSLDRNNAAIMTKMGEAYGMQGNTAAAISSYRKAMQSNPSFMPAYLGISDLFDRRGDGEAAMVELRSALNVNPKFMPARNQLGRLALTVDKPDQALQYYRESLKINPNDPEAIRGLSQALTVVAHKDVTISQALGQESDLVMAEQAINEALALNPNEMRLHLAKLRISRLAGKPAMSFDELQRIISQQPQSESDELIQGEAYLALGQYPEADRVFNSLIQRNRGDSDKLMVIADTLKANGDLDRARDAFQAVLNDDPNNLKAQRGIQRIETAKADSEKTLRLANALNNWRQKNSSVDYYEEALAKNPRQPEARLELAKLYEKQKEYGKAASSYQFYLGLMPNLEEKKRRHYEKKITKLQDMAEKKTASAKPIN